MDFNIVAAREYCAEVYAGAPEGFYVLSYFQRGAKDLSNYCSADIEKILWKAEKVSEAGATSIYLRTTLLGSRPKQGRGKATDSIWLPGLWADLDYGTVGHKEENLPPDAESARRVIEEAGLPVPTLWVDSGGGLYPWWLVEGGVELDGGKLWADISTALQRVIKESSEKLGWEYGAGVGDMTRILRLAGSTNGKVPGLPRPCAVVGDVGERYTAEELRAAVEVLAGPVQERAKAEEKDSFELLGSRGPFAELAESVGIDGVLKAAGWEECPEYPHRGESNQCYSRPGGGSTTDCSAVVFGDQPNVLVVFSESAGLPSGEGQKLTAGRLFSWLHHGGDESAATKDLKQAKNGGGSEAARMLIEYGLPVQDIKKEEESESGEKPDIMVDADLIRLVIRWVEKRYRCVGDFGWARWTGKKWDLKGASVMARKGIMAAMRYIEEDKLADIDYWYSKASKKVKGDTAAAEELKARYLKARSVIRKRLGGVGTCDMVMKGIRPYIAMDMGGFDQSWDYLNCENGVVDLRTGDLIDHELTKEFYFTKCTNVDYVPGATSGDFDRVLEALPDDAREWMQRRSGQGALGRPPGDDTVQFFKGSGENGKSTFLAAMQGCLGEFAGMVPKKLLTSSGDKHDSLNLELLGLRLAFIEELPNTKFLDTENIKDLSGAVSLSGRPMRETNYVVWSPTHTLWVTTNHNTGVAETDHGTWRRLDRVPFPYTFLGPRRDPLLRDRVRDGLNGVREAALAWVVEGAKSVLENPLTREERPRSVSEATREWMGESNPTVRFATECLEVDAGSAVLRSDVYLAYTDWAKSRGQSLMNDQTFWSRAANTPVLMDPAVSTGFLSTSGSEIYASREVGPRERIVLGVKLTNDGVRAIRSATKHDSFSSGRWFLNGVED